MITDATGAAARIPHALRRLLDDALALRARRDAAQIGGAALDEAIAGLEARADKLISARVTNEANRRLLAHLGKERHALFSFLKADGVPATKPRRGAGHPTAGLCPQELGWQQDRDGRAGHQSHR